MYFCVLGSCHFGNIIEYDTVTNLSWSVDARTHAIAQMVDRILSEPWAAANELGLEVPPLKRQDDCLVSLRVPSHNIEVFSHWCCCRIATNGTLETIAYDIRDVPILLYTPLANASLPSHDQTRYRINCLKKDVRDGLLTVLTESRSEFDRFQIRVPCSDLNAMTLFSFVATSYSEGKTGHPKTVERQ